MRRRTSTMETKHFNCGMAVQHLVSLCLHLLLFSVFPCSGTSIGVLYDSRDNTLPSPKKLVKLLKEHDIFQLSLLDANPNVLESLSGTGIEVTVGMSYKEIEEIGNSKPRAASWLKKNVIRFKSDTLITGIDVDHEETTEEAITSLVSTMTTIYSALSDVNLDEHIKVTATLSSTLLQDASTELASSSTKDLRQVLHPLLNFLFQTGSLLVVNTIIPQNSASSEDLVNSIVAAANNVMAFLQYPDIPIAIDVLCPASSGTDTFLITKNLRTQVPIQDINRVNIFAVLVKMNSLNCSSHKELGGPEQFPSTSRELLDKKANSTRNETSQIDSSLVGETTPTTPITTPITTPTTTPITTPTTPVITPITTPITSPTTPTTTPITTPVTTPTTPTTPTTGSSGSWCVAKPGVSDTSLQVALDYACGLGGADCGPIQQGGTCYNPDTVAAHASYAFDSFYKKNGMTPASCEFGGNAMVTNQDPSSGICTYSTGSGGSSVLNTSIGNGGLGSIAPANSSDAASIFFCLPIFFTLVSLLLSIIVGQRL